MTQERKDSNATIWYLSRKDDWKQFIIIFGISIYHENEYIAASLAIWKAINNQINTIKSIDNQQSMQSRIRMNWMEKYHPFSGWRYEHIDNLRLDALLRRNEQNETIRSKAKILSFGPSDNDESLTEKNCIPRLCINNRNKRVKMQQKYIP